MVVAMVYLTTNSPDLFESIVGRDWNALGGWGLFLSLVLFIVIGAFREWWVPGPRYRRQEDILSKTVDVLSSTTSQNEKLIQANEITKHFFEEVTPRRMPRRDAGDTDLGDTPKKGRHDESS